MKRIPSLFIAFTFSFLQVSAQDGNLQQTARTFMVQGDFDNAIVVLNRALQQNPNSLDAHKDLALAYYYKRDYAEALEQLEPIMEKDNADVVTYQIAGNIYKALEDVKEAGKMYKRALKKFPSSGALYSEYGELLWSSKDNEAIKQWEKGIQADPGFAGNYYNAALYYSYTKDVVWTLLYGEIFVNMESLTERAIAMKKLLLDTYKGKLFTDADITKSAENSKSEFAKGFLQTISKQASVTNQGITTESLIKLRTRFILDWYAANYGAKYPFRLFDYHQQLLREGMFEAYNQWLFGTVENLPLYENWTKTHAEEYSNFTTFQKGRVFRMPQGQYYQQL